MFAASAIPISMKSAAVAEEWKISGGAHPSIATSPPANQKSVTAPSDRREWTAPRSPAKKPSAITGRKSSGLRPKCEMPSNTGPMPVAIRCALADVGTSAVFDWCLKPILMVFVGLLKLCGVSASNTRRIY